MPVAIGIDFGSTNSCIAYAKAANDVDVITNEGGDRVTPSYVSFTEEEHVVGLPAKQQMARNAKNTVFGVKRVLGKKLDEVSAADKRRWQCAVVEKDGQCAFQIDHLGETKEYMPAEIIEMIMAKLKETAEHYIGDTVDAAVLSVPVSFTPEQREPIVKACEAAGMEVLRVIHEPTAAALMYGIGQGNDREEDVNILVYDMGAHSLDITLLNSRNGVYQVLKTGGNPELGGSAFETRLMQVFAAEFHRKYKMNVTESKRAVHKLRTECERVAQVLSSTSSTMASIESLMEGVDLHTPIDREQFDKYCADIFASAMAPLKALIEESGLPKNEIHHVILTGGATKIPKLQQLMHEYLDEGSKHLYHVAGDETVACGAALEAALLYGHSHTQDNEAHIEAHVLPASIGLEDAEGNFVTLLGRHAPVPLKKNLAFKTAPGQTSVLLKLRQGDSKVAADNKLLFEIALKDVKPETQIQLHLYAREDGSVHVTALDSATGERLTDQTMPVAA